MHKNEKVPANNPVPKEAAPKEPANREEASPFNVSELVQSVADSMMREAREVTARIKKAAEAESAGLLEEARKQAEATLGKAQKDAQAIEAESARRLGDVKKQALAILGKAQEDSRAAEADSARLLGEARKQAEAVLGKAQEDAQAVEADSARRQEDARQQAEAVLGKAQENARAAEANSTRLLEEAGKQAEAILGKAQQEAQTVEAESVRRLEDARQQSEAVLGKAQQDARAAEAESAGLLEEARKQAEAILGKAKENGRVAAEDREKAAALLQQAKQQAIAIQAEVTREAAQIKLRLKEDIDRHLAGVMEKIRQDLRPSLDYLVKRAQTIEEELGNCIAGKTLEIAIAPQGPSGLVSSPEAHETGRELHSVLGEAIASADVTAYESSGEEDASGEGRGEVAVGERSDPAPDCPDLLKGMAEIHVAPPISIARLLGVTRYLESTQHVKVLQTSGSWSLGSVITVSLEKAIPLVNILREVPSVAEANVADDIDEISGSRRSGPRRIEVTLTGSGEGQAGGKATQ